MQPGREAIGVANLAGIAEQYQKGGLEGVVGLGFRSSQVAARGPDQPAVAADEIGEGPLVAIQEAAQQFAIAFRRRVGERAENSLEGKPDHGRLERRVMLPSCY